MASVPATNASACSSVNVSKAGVSASFDGRLRRVVRFHLLAGRVPHARDHLRMEVAESAQDHRRVDIAQHAATTEEVEPVAVDPELLAARDRGRVEVERGTDVAGLL